MFPASAANNQGDSLQFCFTHQQQVFSTSWTQTNHHDQVVFELLWCVLCWVDLYVVSSSWPRQWGWRSENRLWLQPPFQEGWVAPPLPSWDAIKEMLFTSQLPENPFINNRKCFTWKQRPWSRLDCDLLQLSELSLCLFRWRQSPWFPVMGSVQRSPLLSWRSLKQQRQVWSDFEGQIWKMISPEPSQSQRIFGTVTLTYLIKPWKNLL